MIPSSNKFIVTLEHKDPEGNVSWTVDRKVAYEYYLIGARAIQFVILCLSAGMIINFGSKKYNYPYTVGCFLFGILVGFLDVQSPFVREFTYITRMNPNDIMLTFLPILVFESSFNMDAHVFYRALVPCLILAVPGLIFCILLSAVFAKFALHSYGWSWFTALLFGSVVSATDPVAVVALLKEMRMPHTFTILIEGESLLNDGVAIVLYESFLHHIIANTHPEFLESTFQLVKTSLGAPIFGYVSAKVAEFILTKIYISPVTEMTLTLIQAYITYFIAERFLGISAVVAVVLFGVTLNANKMCISPESESLIHTDWRLLSVYANTLIFVIVGVIVSVKLSVYFDFKDAWFIFITYVSMTIFRFLMVAVFSPLLKSCGYGLTWKEAIVLAWGGLRGGVGLALGLMFASNPKIDKSENAGKVLVQVSGIIILTLLINANTIKLIMKLIRFKEITLVHRLSMGNAIACVKEMREKSIRVCKRDWKFNRADWSWLQHKTKLFDPYKGGVYGDDPNMSSLFIPIGTCEECTKSILPYRPDEEEREMLNEAARKKVLRAMKGNVWKQFRKGLIQRRTLKYLSMALDTASDVRKTYLTTEDVEKFMNMNSCVNWVERKSLNLLRRLQLKESAYDKELLELHTEHPEGFRKLCLWIYNRWWFEPAIIAVVIADFVAVVTHFLGYRMLMPRLSIFFVLFFGMEITSKIVTLKWYRYIKNPWNKMDLMLTLPTLVEAFLDCIMVYCADSKDGINLHTRIVIVVRIIRIGRALRISLMKMLSYLTNHLSRELYSKYDVGRGFLIANEAVLKKIGAIVDFGPSAEIPITVCENNVQQMLKILADFERQHASVAYALKCNRAARRILNKVKVVLERFSMRSLILREDMKQLKHILFDMTKRIVCAPKTRPVIEDIPKILEQSDWIRNSGILQLIKDNHTVCSFKKGEVVQDSESNHHCIYIVASGIVKILKPMKSSLSQIKLYNKLCNTDSFLVFENPSDAELRDYLMPAQTIGLLGYLQKTKSVTSAICEDDCEMLQIDFELLRNAEEDYQLLYFMWRYVAINVAVPILKQQPRYMDFTDDDIKLRLHRSIMPSMENVTNWHVPPVVEDMVLIQGKAKDDKSSARFLAPAYIPSNYRNLVMLDDIKKRPPVIIILLPIPKCKLRLCEHWAKLDEMKSDSLCTVHDSRLTLRL